VDRAKLLSLTFSSARPILVEAALRYLKGLLGERSPGAGLEEDEEVVALAQQIANTIPALGRRLAIALSKGITEGEAWQLSQALGMRVRREGEGYSVHVVDFLKAKPPEKVYKLIYNPPRAGWVSLDGKRFRRVVEGAFVKAMLAKPPFPVERGRLTALLPKAKRVSVKVERHPPCIERIMAELKAGVNLSHYARWLLAVYLYNVGLSKDEIVDLYRSLPDFKEKVTRYHVEYIFKKGYSVPSCDKIKGYGLCVKNCGVSHPLELVKGHGRKGKGVGKGKA